MPTSLLHCSKFEEQESYSCSFLKPLQPTSIHSRDVWWVSVFDMCTHFSPHEASRTVPRPILTRFLYWACPVPTVSPSTLGSLGIWSHCSGWTQSRPMGGCSVVRKQIEQMETQWQSTNPRRDIMGAKPAWDTRGSKKEVEFGFTGLFSPVGEATPSPLPAPFVGYSASIRSPGSP